MCGEVVAIEVAVAQGKILYVGSSNFAGWHIAQAQAAAAAAPLRRPQQRAVDLQPRRARHRARGDPGRAALRPGLIPWSPLKVGCSAACCARSATASAASRAGRPRPSRQPRPDRGLRGLRRRTRARAGRVALAWLLHQPAVTAPIVGPRTQEQLDSAVRALDVHLDEKALARLDEIFPGYRTAPEHYAW